MSATTAVDLRIQRLWRDTARGEQNDRFEELRYIQTTECEAAAAEARRYAHSMRERLADEYERRTGQPAGRIEVPSAHAFARVLGLFRTGATLKPRKGRRREKPITRLQISRHDIARLTQLGPTTTALVLKWLDTHAYEHRGVELDVKPLGWIHRCRRYGLAVLHTGGTTEKRFVHRTNATVLTDTGKVAVGLLTAKEAEHRATVRSLTASFSRPPRRAAQPASPTRSPPQRRVALAPRRRSPSNDDDDSSSATPPLRLAEPRESAHAYFEARVSNILSSESSDEG